MPRPARRPAWAAGTKAYAMHKAAGRRGKLRSRGSRTPEREARSVTERGVSRGHSPWTRSLGTFKEARSRREQPGWTAARTSAGPHSGPQTSPSRREAGRREQAQHDNSGVRESTSSAGTRTGELCPSRAMSSQAAPGGAEDGQPWWHKAGGRRGNLPGVDLAAGKPLTHPD